jgi:hypothetical protein
LIQGYRDACQIQVGQKFVVRVSPGCPTGGIKRGLLLADADARFAKREAVLASYNSTLRDPNNDGKRTYVAVELSSLTSGTYQMQTLMNDIVDRVSVLSSEGTAFYSNNSRGSAYQISFQVDVDPDDELDGAVIAYTHQEVNVSYTATVKPNAAVRRLSPSYAAWLIWLGSAATFALIL